MKLGILLRKLRNQKKLSQSELAEQLGVGQSTYCTWESDQSLPKATYYARLANVFGVDLSELLTDELTVTVSTPVNSTAEPTTLNAKTLYEELTASQKQTILLQQHRIEHLEAENQQLRNWLAQTSEKLATAFLFIISPINFISNLIEIIGLPIVGC